MPLDGRQVEEMLLTTAQSAFAIMLIADLRFSLRDGALLLGLFSAQFVFPSPEVRYGLAAIFLALTVGMIVFGGSEKRRALRALPKFLFER
jgi:cation:H+ antiporter